MHRLMIELKRSHNIRIVIWFFINRYFSTTYLRLHHSSSTSISLRNKSYHLPDFHLNTQMSMTHHEDREVCLLVPKRSCWGSRRSMKGVLTRHLGMSLMRLYREVVPAVSYEGSEVQFDGGISLHLVTSRRIEYHLLHY